MNRELTQQQQQQLIRFLMNPNENYGISNENRTTTMTIKTDRWLRKERETDGGSDKSKQAQRQTIFQATINQNQLIERIKTLTTRVGKEKKQGGLAVIP